MGRGVQATPIGGITFYRDGNHSSTLDDPVIGAIAKTHGKSPAQVMLRWGLQHGRSVIPKSTKPSRNRREAFGREIPES
jgi:diketogulonate reductase-like aldo/keto reductase